VEYLKFDFNSCNVDIEKEIWRLEKIEALKLINETDMPFIKVLKQNLLRIKEALSPYKMRFDNMFVVGIGGSSLGIQTIYRAIFGNNPKEGKKLFFLENVDPFDIDQIFQSAPWDRTVYCFISKSGKTLETVSIMNLVLNELRKRGFKDIDKRTIFISDPGSPFHILSKEIGSTFFEIPPDIGGRFSVLTPVGLVPSEFLDVDPFSLIEGAREVIRKVDIYHPSLLTAIVKFLNYQKGRNISVMMPYSDRLRRFSNWYVQLWAESLGKNGKGQTPLRAVGTVDQHSLLQLFMEGPDDKFYQFIKINRFESDFILPERTEILKFLSGKKLSEVINAEFEGTVQALKNIGRPVLTITLNRVSPETLGALFMYYMIATVVTGKLMNVNPFGQPGVEAGKKIATKMLMG